MAEIEKKPVKIVETILRDAHQSLIATRMTTDQMMLKLKLPKRMANNPWVKENAIFLDSINYNCK